MTYPDLVEEGEPAPPAVTAAAGGHLVQGSTTTPTASATRAAPVQRRAAPAPAAVQRGFFDDVWETASGAASSVASGIKKAATTTGRAIGGAASSAWDATKSGASSLWNRAKGGASSLWNKAKGGASSLWGKVKGGASSLWGKVKGGASTLWGKVKGGASSLWDQGKRRAAQLWANVTATGSSLIAKAKAKWRSIKDGWTDDTAPSPDENGRCAGELKLSSDRSRCLDQRINGCGPADSLLENLVPDSGGPVWNFYEACAKHDVCYGTEGASQQQCDNNMMTDMQSICSAHGPGHRDACMVAARVYHKAVAGGGRTAFERAQGRSACPPLKRQLGLCSVPGLD